MFRWPKPWSKKRGDRRTGSPIMGNVWETLLFCLLFLLGTIALVVMFTSAHLRTWPAGYFFPELYFVETQTIVRDAFLVEVETEGDSAAVVYRPELLVEWRAGERVDESRIPLADGLSERETGLTILDWYQQGESYPGWHDPLRPGSLCMKRPGRYRFGLTLIAVVASIFMGGARVLHAVMSFGTSPERRAALAGRAAKLDIVREAAHRADEFPTIPGVEDMSNSPGVALAYRLPIVHSSLIRLLAAAMFCLVWICIAAVFVQVVVSDVLRGRPVWFLGLVTLVFLGLGVWSLRYFWWQLLFATSVGPTSVEISDHPLYPGNGYQITLMQAGRVDLDRLQLQLVCDEKATFREGTDVRTELREVHKHEIFAGHDVCLRAGKPFEHAAVFEVPADVMHSFHSDNNSVQWKITVDGIISGTSFRRQFPVIIYPRTDNGQVGERNVVQTES